MVLGYRVITRLLPRLDWAFRCIVATYTCKSGVTHVPLATEQTGNKTEQLIMLLQSAISTDSVRIIVRPL